MKKWTIHFLAVILGLFVAAYFVPGVSISGLYAAGVVAAVLGVMNLVIRPILVFLTLPITVVTLGLFIFVINALIFMFVGTVVKGFEVHGFVAALLGSLVVSIVSSVVQKIT